MLTVGNDVVDLTAAGNPGKSRDERWLRKVLTDDERGLVRRAADPDRALWSLWAAKEAAYKARRREGAIAFVPRRIRVCPRRLSVAIDGRSYSLAWRDGGGWIHCVAHRPCDRIAVAIEPVGSAEPGADSLALRALARRLLGMPSLSIRGGGRLPPVTELPGVALSFSHDGGLVAIAIAQAPGEPHRAR